MKHIEIVNCFINGAAHTYMEERKAPLVDEDLSMAFDAADDYATVFPRATIEEAHAAGREYMGEDNLPISQQEEEARNAAAEAGKVVCLEGCEAYKTIRHFQQEQNADESHTFIGTVVENEEGDFGIYILDSYSQGIALVLTKDGRYSAFPCGG